MALNPHASAATRKLMADAMIASASLGILRIYSGAQPADGDASVGAGVVLAELTMNVVAFVAVASVPSTPYSIAANPIAQDVDANATGTAAWFRLFDATGLLPILDGTVGTAGTDLIMNSTAVQIHTAVSATSLTLSLPA